MWFTKTRTSTPVDVVWFTKAAKLSGIVDTAGEATAKSSEILIFAHFRDTLGEVDKVLEENWIKHRVIEQQLSASTLSSGLPSDSECHAYLCLSERIPPAIENWNTEGGREAPRIIVAERYPNGDRDVSILSLTAAYGINEVQFHSSLEDPLLRAFGSERMIALLRTMSEDESSPIVSKHITSAIKSAQKKIKKTAMADQRVPSAEDWFTYNMPKSG